MRHLAVTMREERWNHTDLEGSGQLCEKPKGKRERSGMAVGTLEVKMVVCFATWVKRGRADRTGGVAITVLAYSQLRMTSATQDYFFFETAQRPNSCSVIRDFRMALKTRIIFFAAGKFDSDHIDGTMIMGTPRLCVHIHTVNLYRANLQDETPPMRACGKHCRKIPRLTCVRPGQCRHSDYKTCSARAQLSNWPECVPSQNGFLFDMPQRQSVNCSFV